MPLLLEGRSRAGLPLSGPNFLVVPCAGSNAVAATLSSTCRANLGHRADQALSSSEPGKTGLCLSDEAIWTRDLPEELPTVRHLPGSRQNNWQHGVPALSGAMSIRRVVIDGMGNFGGPERTTNRLVFAAFPGDTQGVQDQSILNSQAVRV